MLDTEFPTLPPEVMFQLWKNSISISGIDNYLDNCKHNEKELRKILSDLNEALRLVGEPDLSMSIDVIQFLREIENISCAGERKDFHNAMKVNRRRQNLELWNLKYWRSDIGAGLMRFFSKLLSNYQTSVIRPLLLIFFLLAVIVFYQYQFTSNNHADFGKLLRKSLTFTFKPLGDSEDNNGWETVAGFLCAIVFGALVFMIKHAYNRISNYKW